jgi:YD repeat-containing protein
MLQTQVHDVTEDELLVTETQFDAQGMAYRQYLPFYASGDWGTYQSGAAQSQFTETEYDALGRVTSVTQPGNIITTTSYEGLTTTVTDPNGNKVSRTTDGLGRLKHVTEYTDIGAIYALTQYAYDGGDRLIQVTDAQFNITTIQYDWLGRKTGMDDPDMGVWDYEYYSTGSLKQQTDAREQDLSFEYDALNRLTKKRDADLSADLATYVYGVAQGEIGFRTSMTDQSGSTTWDYSNFGRTVDENRVISGSTQQTMTTTSDWLGRPVTVEYPDSEVLTYSYDALGRPKNLDSSLDTSISLVDLAYNTLGQITGQVLGNGVTLTNTYSSNTNRLSRREAEDNSSTTLLDLEYTYESNGNIATITDNVLDEEHSYAYDFLNRRGRKKNCVNGFS